MFGPLEKLQSSSISSRRKRLVWHWELVILSPKKCELYIYDIHCRIFSNRVWNTLLTSLFLIYSSQICREVIGSKFSICGILQLNLILSVFQHDVFFKFS